MRGRREEGIAKSWPDEQKSDTRRPWRISWLKAAGTEIDCFSNGITITIGAPIGANIKRLPAFRELFHEIVVVSRDPKNRLIESS